MKMMYAQLFFAAVILVLIGVSYGAYKNLENYIHEVQMIRHSNEIIKETQGVLSVLKDVETGQRGYQLTRDTAYLKPYYLAVKTFPTQFKRLDSLVRHSDQEAKVDSLRVLAREQFVIVSAIVTNVARSALVMDRYESDLLARGKQNMNAIRAVTRRILDHEETNFNRRVSSENAYQKMTPLTLLVYAVIAVVALTFMFSRIVSALKKSKSTEALLSMNLEKQKHQTMIIEERKVLLNEAESVAQMGSWKWADKTNEMVWSDGLYKIFSKAPVDAISFTSFFENIYPDDRVLMENFLHDVKVRKKGSRIDYRITRDDQLRYVSITAKPQASDRSQEIVLVGAVIDVTESKVNEKQLQQYNAELRRSNEDLEQFAYVASHDLQEPLRKIRAFGDRLVSKYGDRLEDQGRDYISRMQAASARMQLLIEDLLSFSRVSRADADFELIDSKILLNEVLDDIDVQVSQERAVVKIGAAPEFYGDKSQMKRLFQNLIGNAVKFHKLGEKPVIDVSGRLLERAEAEVEVGVQLRNPQYVRFSIKDNGIGFHEKYAEKIFNIFQRLNGRTSFEGTGIGLAICRKIVTNHKGFISAKSIEDVGSEFVVILPKDLTATA